MEAAASAAGPRASPSPGVAASLEERRRGSTRRSFFLTVGVAAAGLACRTSPSAESGVPRVTADHGAGAGEAVDANVRAVRDHVLRLESPPAFVFTTKYRDVP